MSEADPIATDPFFKVLRERHPDVDIVLLPALEPRAADVDAWTDDPRIVEERSAQLLGEVIHAMGVEAAPGPPVWRDHPEAPQRYVRFETSWAATPPVPELRRLGTTLLELGWDAEPVATERPTLRATRAGHILIAEVSTAEVDLELTSPPVVIPATEGGM